MAKKKKENASSDTKIEIEKMLIYVSLITKIRDNHIYIQSLESTLQGGTVITRRG
jgi:hypothetical protein